MTQQSTEWLEEHDALRAAPKHHALLFENEKVRVLDTNISPGQTVPLHTHRWRGVHYILSFSNFVRRDAGGKVLVDSRNSGKLPEGIALWSEALSLHTLENVGERDLHVISNEVKDRA
jgi:predicted metal-dependent enzyme (double-stranded beta helix superfamily)